MVRRVTAILICGTAMSGCAVHEVHKDHDLIRTTLLDLYTNQIIDNLIRAKNGMPIIQLDYSQATAMVTITNSIAGSDSQAVTASNLLTIPAATLAATRTILTTLMGNLGNMNANQVTIAASPQITSNEVYDAYLQFLDEDKNPGSLMVTDDPPNPGDAHICRKCNGKYYWVPVSYQNLFFKLALLTTAQRGKSLVAPDEFFTVTLKEVTNNEDNKTFPGISRKLTLTLDNKKIPSDAGYMVLDNDKSHEQFPLQSIGGLTSADTDSIVISVDNAKVPQLFTNFPQTAKIFLQHNRPQLPTTNDLINHVSFQLQQIQFNQLRTPNP